jgi:hypothetical protein
MGISPALDTTINEGDSGALSFFDAIAIYLNGLPDLATSSPPAIAASGSPGTSTTTWARGDHTHAGVVVATTAPVDNNAQKVIVAAVGTGTTAARSDHKHARRFYTPADHGLLGWTDDPGLIANATSTLTSGSVGLWEILMPDGGTMAAIHYDVTTAAVTPTASQNVLGVYKVSGTTATLVGYTADQGTNFTSIGPKTPAIATTVAGQNLTVAAGDRIYVGVLWNGTTGPALARVSSNNVARNWNLSAGQYRSCSYTTGGQTSLPSTINLATATSTASGGWAAVA